MISLGPRTLRAVAATACAGFLCALAFGGSVAARQTPAPRVAINPALKAKADSVISKARAGAGRYDQAVAAIARLESAPIGTEAEAKALAAAVDSNLNLIQAHLSDKLMHLALSDAALKQGVAAAAKAQGGKALVAGIRSGGLDRIDGVSSVRAALIRRVQEDGQTYKRAGSVIHAKANRTTALTSSGGGSTGTTRSSGGGRTTVAARTPTAFDAIVAAAVQVFTLVIEDVFDRPEDTPPPPPPSALSQCLTEAVQTAGRCLRDAGINPIKIAICAAEELLAIAACYGIE